jgi:hypothetical protein
MWYVIMHFGRGNTLTYKYATAEEAQKAVEIAVFRNRDCTNCSIYFANNKEE